MASLIFNGFKKNIMNGGIDLDTDAVKVMLLTSGYTADADNQEFKGQLGSFEAAGTGYTAGGQALASKTVTQDNTADKGVFDAADVTWPNSSITARYAVVYKDTGNPATSPLICCFDFGADKKSENADFVIQWNAAGILNLG
jgi:hypothetical protein